MAAPGFQDPYEFDTTAVWQRAVLLRPHSANIRRTRGSMRADAPGYLGREFIELVGIYAT
ncbi:hypothetical protein N7523_002057 [Penicillium sp. IBT 18751x]|nr:hypothetical protein N7523_002057 [Penicillium sp. IBT 18751x]